jgi:putative endonuclease
MLTSQSSHKARGKHGEEVAQALLERAGYQIVDINVHFGAKSGLVGEIDIVAWEGKTLAFVEVKTRLSGNELPLEAVTRHKQQQMTRLALAYVTEHGLMDADDITLRFDVVALLLSPDGDFIRRKMLVRGAFLAEDVG